MQLSRCVGAGTATSWAGIAGVVLIDLVTNETIVAGSGIGADTTSLDAGIADLGGGIPEVGVVAHVTHSCGRASEAIGQWCMQCSWFR